MNKRKIVGSIVKNQASGTKGFISESIFDTVMFYIYCSGDEVYEVLKLELDQILEEQDGPGEAIQTRRNLKDTHMITQENVRRKLDNYLGPLLEVPST